MRWNCPHCEELVTAGIDFETTQQAYVRCGKCGGMALVHRSAALAGFVKARRIEEETKLAASAQASANERRWSSHDSVSGNPSLETISDKIPPRSMDALLAANLPIEPELFTATPPPFRGPPTDESAAPPIFSYPKPPAFLMGEIQKPASPATRATGNSTLANLAVWLAAALALGSGIYLYIQGKKALTANDQIVSKSSSGIRPEAVRDVRNFGIVKVPRAVVRGAPSTEAAVLGTLTQASVIVLLEEKEGWIRVESPKLTTGSASAWLRSDLVARIAD